ncbi:AbrB/MazE/SpoVT family DNA-binding domain-containing protein [Salinibacter ruber]|uniref:Addiction module antidote n=1 Tax=Salinibacter ruber TaxID=146919 RepID=A0A9X2U7W3_9BACT|nr:AbrB/MazE/SpoVT family DNA-binding domain-containing protein [Salinibacter ruber]MCS3656654.1 putative addiction module antidote [Salinibacter ruber]MCS3666880.1 putative addiction module antidote [Salinibacter ruber]MCS3951419.1 putative addiction module antidote [Salinibacter ruber]MCS4117862.1 putative addiction module antidote [Salinibacter ruber]MCS4154523.1 putative addiction module antidote [Salinibacter ruber]
MPEETAIRRIGNSSGLTIPKDLLDRQHLEEDDQVHLVETEDGLLITPYGPDFEDAMEAYEEGARDYRNALRALSDQ